MPAREPPTLFVVAGEPSGDRLGADLMKALRRQRSDVSFLGVGGEAMQREGLHSLFPLADIAVMGIVPVLRHLPTLLARLRQTVEAVAAAQPAGLIIIDSPDFTHRVARAARRRRPDLPVIDYVSPTVWAWRPGRARRMRHYIDHVLALFPFEPAAHARLGGPACTYVGHPLVDRVPPSAVPDAGAPGDPVLLVLPGSRRSEIERLMPPFGAAVDLIRRAAPNLEIVLPVASGVEAAVRAALKGWTAAPRLAVTAAEKALAFHRARAALAASGTVTLELALAGVPMAVAYKVSPPETMLKYLITAPSIVLPNLVLGSRTVPEFLQGECTPVTLAAAVRGLLDGPAREAQLAAFARLRAAMAVGEPAAQHAARIVWETIAGPR